MKPLTEAERKKKLYMYLSVNYLRCESAVCASFLARCLSLARSWLPISMCVRIIFFTISDNRTVFQSVHKNKNAHKWFKHTMGVSFSNLFFSRAPFHSSGIFFALLMQHHSVLLVFCAWYLLETIPLQCFRHSDNVTAGTHSPAHPQ